MANIQIIVGSMLGGTEYVAEACEEALNELDLQTELHFQPNYSQIAKNKVTWLICTSTHGAGDYPDNIQAFVSELETSNNDLSSINFCVLGTGDSNYDTFCYAAKNISKLLISMGCNEIIPLKTLDSLSEEDPEEIANLWVKANKDLFIQSCQ